MLHKCANPVCGAQFRYLHQGWLFEVEIHHVESISSGGRGKSWNGNRQVERWWLCELCAACISLQFDPQRGLVMVSSVEGSEQVVFATVQSSNPTVQSSNPKTANPKTANPRTAAGIVRILVRPLDLDRAAWTQRRARVRLNARGSEAA